MSQTATGSNSQILIAKESTYGIKPDAASFVKVPFKSCGLDGSQSLNEDDNLGNGREKLAPTLGRKSVSGDMSLPVDLRNIGYWLMGLLGTPVTTEATGVFTHVFSSGKDSLPSLSMEKSFKEVADYTIFTGIQVSQMSFDYSNDGNAAASVSLIAQSEENNSVTIQTNPITNEFLGFANSQAAVSIDGVDVPIMGASLSLSNDLQAVETIRNDNKIDSIDLGMFSAAGSLTVRFNSKELLEKAKSGTPVALTFEFKNSDDELLRIKLFEGYLSKPGKSIDGPGGIELSFDFQGAKNTAASKMIEVELVNNVASY